MIDRLLIHVDYFVIGRIAIEELILSEFLIVIA